MKSAWMRSIITSGFVAIASILMSAAQARAANFVLDADGLYFSDNVAASNKSSESATLFSGFAGFGVDKKNMYEIGWDYSSHSTSTVDASSTVGYNASEMGPEVVSYLDKDRNWRFSIAYDLVTTATYSLTGSSNEKWDGYAINTNIGYQFRWDSSVSIGIRLNYSLDTYSQSVVGSTTTSVSNSKTLIYPSVALTLEM